MSRWVNGSLDELLTLAPGPRISSFRLRDPDLDEAPPPPHSDCAQGEIDRFLDELDADALDLSLRISVLESLVRALPRDRARYGPAAMAALSGVVAVRAALDDVCSRASDRRLAHFVAADAPLGACVKVLHARAAATARAIERFAAPDGGDVASFARDLADAATFGIAELADASRRDLGSVRLGLGSAAVALRELRDAVEGMFAAASRLDTLTAPPSREPARASAPH